MFTKKISHDVVSGSIFLVFGVVLVFQTLKITVQESAVLVYFILVLYFAMSFLIIISGLFSKNKKIFTAFYYKKKELLLLVVLFVYQGLIKYSDFYLLTIPFIFCVNLIVIEKVTKKNMLQSFFFAVVTTLGIYIVCKYGLKIVL